MNGHNDWLWMPPPGFVGNAADDIARHVHLGPSQGCAIAQAQATVNAQAKQDTQFARGRLADGAEFFNGQFPPRLRHNPFALDVFPRVDRYAALDLQNAENQL
jgi:hypothetical protein